MSESRIKMLLPTIAMGLLFIIGISMALIFAPIFSQMNAKADFSELGDFDEESLGIIVIYIGAILIFTGILLIIGRTRKGKFLKYLITGVVGITIIYTFMPLIGYVMYGPQVLIWDDNNSISKDIELVKLDDLDGDGDLELILGVEDGLIQVFDSNSHELEWQSQKMDGEILDLDIIDIESDGKREMIILTIDTLSIYRIHSPTNYELLYSNETGEISSFSPVCDLDGNHALYFGSRLGTIVKQNWIKGSSSEYIPGPIEMFKDNIGSKVTALLSWSHESDSSVKETLLLAGTENELAAYMCMNGTKVDHPNLRPRFYLRNITFIETIEIPDASTTLANTPDRVIVIYTRSSWLSFISYNNFSLIDQFSSIREFKSIAAADLLEEYVGEELVVKGNDQLILFYSKNSLWEELFNAKQYISDFDTEGGSGSGVADIDGDGELEIVIGTSKGYSYGEIGVIESTDIPCYAALMIAVVVIGVLIFYPEWYVINISGLLMGAGVCAIIGISIAIFPILVFLIALAIYDAISVYKTKHMIDLADNVMDMKLPIILIIPKKLNYSYIHQKRLKQQLASDEEREAMFMGLGDLIIPGALVVSAYNFLPDTVFLGSVSGALVVALGTLFGSMLGFSMLMRFVLKGNPQAGLPLLNTGAILGYFITYYLVFQDFSFGLSGIAG